MLTKIWALPCGAAVRFTISPIVSIVSLRARVVVTKLPHAPHSASMRTYTGTSGASLAAASAQQKPRVRVERRGMAERRARGAGARGVQR